MSNNIITNIIKEELDKSFHSGIASAMVINHVDNSILILQRAGDSSWMANKWNFPGGKVEIGESFEQGAIRETKEEAGITINNLQLFKEFKTNNGWNIQIFITHSYSGNVKIDFESSNAHWLKEDEINEFDFVPNIKSIIEDVFELINVNV